MLRAGWDGLLDAVRYGYRYRYRRNRAHARRIRRAGRDHRRPPRHDDDLTSPSDTVVHLDRVAERV